MPASFTSTDPESEFTRIHSHRESLIDTNRSKNAQIRLN